MSVDMLLIHENFFSMKLATINSSLESNPDAALSIEVKEIFHEYIIMPRTCLDSQTRNSPQVMDLFKPRHTDPEKLIYKAMFKWVLEMSSTRAATTVVLRQHYRKPQPCEEGVLFCFNNMP
ncbi:unnamed protein product [Brassica rapa subsp. narinosa]|nr:unnamed protein product [Brassica napus]